MVHSFHTPMVAKAARQVEKTWTLLCGRAATCGGAATPHAQIEYLARIGRADDILLSFSETCLLELLPLIVRVLPLKGSIPSKKPSQMPLYSMNGSICPCSFVIFCCHESTCHSLPLMHTEDGELLGGNQKEPALLKYSVTL